MSQASFEFRDVSMAELASVLDRVKPAVSAQDHETLAIAIQMLGAVLERIHAQDASIPDLRAFLMGMKSEKRSKLGTGKPKGDEQGDGGATGKEKKKRKGHGRIAHEEFTGARRLRVPLESLRPGDSCPCCQRGRVYPLAEPRRSFRFYGQAPIMAEIAECEAYRCNGCQEIFTAQAPPGFGEKKYDETAGSMTAGMKYGFGFPFNRLERLQEALGVPFPASNQFALVASVAQTVAPAHGELFRLAAQGTVLNTDDTTMRVLALAGTARPDGKDERDKEDSDEHDPERTGTFTTGIVAKIEEGRRVALFFTGRQHAGENGRDLLEHREPGLEPPTIMFDASSRNLPKGLEMILCISYCLVHARRNFVKLVDVFPEECLHVIDELALVYTVDERAKKLGLSPDERLRLHQDESKPVMDRLRAYLDNLLESKAVEPNSSLGKAIKYMTKRWEALTLFLRKPDAPLDNNLCEQALKRVVLNRKNAYFYKTVNGARVGDILMSLIHTATMAGVNPFDYLTELQKHAEELRADPGAWMPWNYRETLERLGEPLAVPL